MNLSYFISKRIRQGQTGGFSSIIHKIGVVSITVGLAAAIVAFLIMHGFQTAVKNKIYGFSNHILITKFTMSNAVEEPPFNYKIDIYNHPETLTFVKHIQEYIHKAGLVKTDHEVLGIVFKGIGSSFNQQQLRENIVDGRFIHFPDSGWSKEVVISRIIANKIRIKVGEDIIVHFFQNPPRFRRLKVVGIYETNLSEYFDSKVILGDIRMVQQLNKLSSSEAGGLEVMLDMTRFDYYQLRKNDFNAYWNFQKERILENPEVKFRFFKFIGAVYDYNFDFEKAALSEAMIQIGESLDFDLARQTVRDKYIQVFEWLDLVKRQVNILLVIILVVVCVNMISVILIMVMERIPMVGILKAIGAGDRLIRSVFIYNGISLIANGLLFGNILGLGVCYLQYQFRWIKLNAHDYYISYVPIEWSWTTVLFLNFLVFATVTTVLLLPTRFIARISPVQAIRFD